MRTICDGWSVLELGNGSIGASIAGMILADNGARVVAVEPPEGNRLRTEMPSGFQVWCRGKESILADLSTEEGRATVADAARRADVLLAGCSAAQMERWGLSYDALRAVNPALVHCSITGFGSSGEYSHLKAYEGVVAAKAGFFGRGAFGFRDGPIFYNAPWGSLGAAHEAVSGILAALIVRESTGRGQKLDATMVNGLSALDYFGTELWQESKSRGETPMVAISQSAGQMAATRTMMWYATRDSRFITSTGMLTREVRALLRAVGLEHLLDEERFTHTPKFPTADDAQEYEELLWGAFREKDLAEWLPILLSERDIAFEAAVTSEEALEHPQMVHSGEVITLTDPELGDLKMVGPLAHFSKTPSSIDRLAPALGANAGPLTGPAPVSGKGIVEAPAHALAGVTIVECGYFFAMPFSTTLAASLGARVIKIEGCDGDPFRKAFSTPEASAVRVMEGKESLSIDLQHPQGREIVQQLVGKADIFITSFRPGVPERLGLDEQTLRALKPDLVYVQAAGYGTDGPYSDRAMYATSATAAVGGIDRHAGAWLDPKATEGWGVMELVAVVKPRLAAPTDGDSNAALAVLTSMMLGLAHQRRTGYGQYVSLSMLAGNALCYSDDVCSYEGKPPRRTTDEDSFGLEALYRLYRSSDGWVFLAATTDREWDALTRELRASELTADERFATVASRRANDGALARALEDIIARRSGADLERSLSAAGVGCAVASEAGNSAFTSTDPVMLATGLTAEVDHPLFGRLRRHGLPVAFSETPGRIGPSCLRGEHNEIILTELGYTPDDIAELERAAAVFPPDADVLVATRPALA